MTGLSMSGGLTLYLASLVVFIIIYVCILRKKQLTTYQKIIFVTLYVYLVLVIEKTLMPIPLNYTQVVMWKEGYDFIDIQEYYNLVPYFDFSDSLWLRNMVLNIIMFMPFGVLWPLYKEIYQLCMAFTMCAPLWYFDINDLIANVLGGLLGYLMLILVSPYVFKRISKKEIYGEKYEKNN